MVLDRVPLRIDPAELRAFVAYTGWPIDDSVAPRQAAVLTAISRVMRPRLAYRRVAVIRADPHRLTLAGGTCLHIPDIGAHWGPLEAVAAGLATIGDEVEMLARRRRETGDALGAALLDSAASAAVECLAEWGNDYLCQLGVTEGRRVTNRISPGLAGWALAEQAALLALLPAPAIGVSLRTDGSMTPAKSVSFLVGIGAAARVDHYFVQCRRCWAEGCPARRTPALTTVSAVRRSGSPPSKF